MNALEETVNDILKTIPSEIKVNNGKLLFDYSLIDEGIIVTDDYLSIIMDGTLHVENFPEPKEKNYTFMPVYVEKAEEVQIMISEYSINEILISLIQLNILEY